MKSNKLGAVMSTVMKIAAPVLVLVSVIAAQASGNRSEYIVKYKNESIMMSSFADLNVSAMNSAATVQMLDQHSTGSFVTVSIPNAKKLAALAQLLSNPNVEYVVPNAEIKAFFAPITTTALKDQWAIAKVQAEKAWQRTGNKGKRSVVVAVIDTGVDYNHKNLAPNAVAGYDFIKNTNDPMDITSSANPGHGTHCAGIIGSSGLIDGGTVGISPEVSIMPLRFLDENGSGDLNNSIKAVDYAIEKKVDVISASWGAAIGRSQAQPLLEAIQRAEKAGIIFIAAASNDGRNNDSYEVYPAKAGFSNVIAVAASNNSDAKPSWSNFGRATVDLAAPGDAIMSTLPKNSYGNLSGTSMATPLVAGLVAFIKAQDLSLTPLQIRSLLQTTGAKVNIQTKCDCRVDAFAAVDQILTKKLFVSPAAGTFAVGSKAQFEGVYGKAPYTFAVDKADVATIDAKGELTAVKEGEAIVSVKDADGATATSLKIYVGKAGGGGGQQPDPGQPDPGQPGECPIGDPQLCEIICQIMPDAPFCKQ
jgi:thermitase